VVGGDGEGGSDSGSKQSITPSLSAREAELLAEEAAIAIAAGWYHPYLLKDMSSCTFKYRPRNSIAYTK
jgi:hypothetical protein